MMGGTLHGKGNQEGGKEFNFKTDPEAAQIVFESLPMIHLVPWEAALECKLTEEDYKNLFDEDYPICKFTKNICEHVIKKVKKCIFCDGLAAVAAVDLSTASY